MKYVLNIIVNVVAVMVKKIIF